MSHVDPASPADRLIAESANELFENAPCGYLVLRPDGTIENVNQTLLHLCGYDRAALLSGTRFLDLLTVPGRIFFETHFAPLLKMQGRVKEIAFDLARRGREPLPVLINAAEQRASDGRVLRTWLTIFDATDRRRYERELLTARKRAEESVETEREAKRLAEHANRAKDEFLAMISHEIRTPLNAILGWTQLMQRDVSNPDDVREGLSIIERNARVQVQLIEDLLDMGRITSGKIRLDVQRVDLMPVIEQAVATARPAADAKSIRLQTVLDPSVIVSGDPDRLQQVFWNLLSNAIKFTPKEGFVRVVMRRVNSHIEVNVIDSGQGMRPDFIAHAFDRFRQADSANVRRSGGLGLGLSIVKHLIEMHGGSVSAASEGEGKGSTFTVSLPVTVVQEEGKAHPRAALLNVPDTVERISLAGVKVLAVEDEPDSREMIQRLLARCGAEVATAGSVAEALEALERFKPHVLISDIGLPGQDGYELIHRVRMLSGGADGVKAIALTAFGGLADRTKAMLAGYHMHLAKPVEPSELIVTVASLVGGILDFAESK